jgi:hypothetical protein
MIPQKAEINKFIEINYVYFSWNQLRNIKLSTISSFVSVCKNKCTKWIKHFAQKFGMNRNL